MFEGEGDAPGGPRGPIRVMPLSFGDWNPKNPWRRTVGLEEFRAGQRAENEAAAAAGPPVPIAVPVVPVEVVDHVTPPVPADVMVEPEGWLERVDAEIEAWLAVASPEDRYAFEFGTPATPEQLEAFAPVSLERAAHLQDLAVQAHRVRTIADAHRIAALLTARDASIADLTARFGPVTGSGDGMGGRAFSTSIALLTKSDPRQVSHEVTAGLFLRDRLPATWAVFQAGDTTWARAQKAVKQAEGLDEENLPAYDLKAADIVVTSTRVKADLRRERERLQDDTAAKRAKTTFERRTVTLEHGPDSGAALVAEGLATEWVPRFDAIQRLAVAAHGIDPEQRTVSQLRHEILGRAIDLGLEAMQSNGDPLIPGRTNVKVLLILTVPALAWLGKTTEQAILGGYGPISIEQARVLAGSAKSFIRVLTDPTTGVRLTMDRKARKPPKDLARWVRIRDGRTRFPGKTTPADLSDLDHAWEWHDHGPTNERNLITLDRPSHLAKSKGLYSDRLNDDGTVGIIDPWNRYFEDPPNEPLDPAPRELLPPEAADDGPCPF